MYFKLLNMVIQINNDTSRLIEHTLKVAGSLDRGGLRLFLVALYWESRGRLATDDDDQ